MKRYWLCFIKDDGSREACSVYYSGLYLAERKDVALSAYAKDSNTDVTRVDAEEMKLTEL